MNSFIYNVPTKIYFGENQLGHLGEELSKFGKNVLLTYGGGSIKKSGLYDEVISEIKKSGLNVFELSGIDPNPRVTSVNEGANICKKEKIDVVLAVGGGSVIDCSKFICAGALYDGDAWDISINKVDVKKCLPLVTILTLSATGTEMNSGGVITNLDTNDKVGNGFKEMLPKVSFLNPALTYTVNEYQTACGSVDILSHIIEQYFVRDQDLQMLDHVMEALMKTVIEYAPIAMKDPNNYEARANLMWASSWALNGFVSGGKKQGWSCHPMEHELSAYYDITHGLGLAILTTRWFKYVLDDTTVDKFYQFGVNVFEIDKNLPKQEVAEKAIECTEKFFFETLKLDSSLSKINIDDKHFEIMAEKASNHGAKYGYKNLMKEDIIKIFQMCAN